MDFERRLNMTKNKTRFITVSYRGIKGIRKDARTKKFVVEKYVRGRAPLGIL